MFMDLEIRPVTEDKTQIWPFLDLPCSLIQQLVTMGHNLSSSDIGA